MKNSLKCTFCQPNYNLQLLETWNSLNAYNVNVGILVKFKQRSGIQSTLRQ